MFAKYFQNDFILRVTSALAFDYSIGVIRMEHSITC